MDARDLAKAMLDWGDKRKELDALEEKITNAVLAMKKTQTVGDVCASYFGGKKTYDYESAGAKANKEIISKYTQTVDKTDWKKVCEEAELKPDYTESGAKVTMKFST